jgi:hypothetical protein
VQAGLLVQVRKVNSAHAVAQRDDVTIVPPVLIVVGTP